LHVLTPRTYNIMCYLNAKFKFLPTNNSKAFSQLVEVRKRVLVNADIGSLEVGLSSVHCARHLLCVMLIAVLLIKLPTERIIHQIIRINVSYWYESKCTPCTFQFMLDHLHEERAVLP